MVSTHEVLLLQTEEEHLCDCVVCQLIFLQKILFCSMFPAILSLSIMADYKLAVLTPEFVANSMKL